MVKIEGTLKKLLMETGNYAWEYHESEKGFGMICCPQLQSFGNPNDRLWDLIVSSDYPIYLRSSSTELGYAKLCKDPKNVRWFFDEKNNVVFESDDGTFDRLKGVSIYLNDLVEDGQIQFVDAEDIIKLPVGIGVDRRINIPDVAEFILEQYKKTYHIFSAEFVDAIIRYYKA